MIEAKWRSIAIRNTSRITYIKHLKQHKLIRKKEFDLGERMASPSIHKAV